MSQRISPQFLYQNFPGIPKHLVGLGNIAAESGIEKSLVHLIKLRISQINGCCYCQHMHSQEARDDNEQQVRLDVLPAWREAPCFSARERAALAWAEAVTLISEKAVEESLYQKVVQEFEERGLIQLTAVCLEINSWNRLAVSFQFVHEFKKA